MRLLFAGTPDVAVPSLRALADSGHDIVGVLTRPDARKGRGRKQATSPVKDLALELGVPILQPATLRDAEAQAAIASLGCDLAPVVAYGGMVPPAALGLPTHGWVNLHFSVLPAWRGAAPVQHAIMAGDDQTGATTFALDKGMDTGPVYGSMTQPIAATDTAGSLLADLATRGAELLVRTVAAIADGSATTVDQPAEGVTYAPQLSTGDARVVWDRPAEVIDRHIRGCTPAPGAWTTLGDKRLKLAPVVPVREDVGAPGRVVFVDGRVLVGAAFGAVELSDVQPAGKRMMPAKAWAAGVRVDSDVVLGENQPQ